MVIVWQVFILIYAVLYFVLVGMSEADNVAQHYPLLYVGLSMVAQTLVVVGVVLYGIGRGKEVTRIWRWLFPVLAADVVAGIAFDAIVGPQLNQWEWLGNEAFSLWFVAPAYYLNFRVAGYGQKGDGSE